MTSYQLLPELTDEEYADLEADIVANGVLQPILVDEHGHVIDGHHRQVIAAAHGIRCPSIKCPPNLSDTEKRSMALGVNLHRRHLTREQKRQVIANALIADPHLSDRQHAERTGSSPSTVGAVRTELEAEGQLSNLDSRTGADGRERPAHVTNTTRVTETTKVERDINLDTGEIIESDQAGPIPMPQVDPALEALLDEEERTARQPLDPEEQRARDLAESINRHARNLERLISLWPWLSDFAVDPHRNEVIALLTEHDRRLLERIEARIIPLDKEDN